MSCLSESLPIIIYMLLIILLIVLIVFLIKSIFLLGKVDRIVDDAMDKVNRLEGLFSVIDNATDMFAMMGDKVVGLIVGGIGRLFKKKEEKKNE